MLARGKNRLSQERSNVGPLRGRISPQHVELDSCTPYLKGGRDSIPSRIDTLTV